MYLSGLAREIDALTTPEQVVLVELADGGMFAGRITNLKNFALELQQYYSHGAPAAKIILRMDSIRSVTKDSKPLHDLAQVIDDNRLKEVGELEKMFEIDIQTDKKRVSHGDNIRASQNQPQQPIDNFSKRG